MATVMTDIKPNIGIEDSDRAAVAQILQETLADETLLYQKLRKFHWNVTGIHFQVLHEMFEEQYEELAEVIDEVAERVVMLGVPAIGTLNEMLSHTQITEAPGTNPDASDMIAELLADHEAIIRKLRDDLEKAEDHGDMGNSDFLTGLMQQHEKRAWMLRAHLQG